MVNITALSSNMFRSYALLHFFKILFYFCIILCSLFSSLSVLFSILFYINYCIQVIMHLCFIFTVLFYVHSACLCEALGACNCFVVKQFEMHFLSVLYKQATPVRLCPSYNQRYTFIQFFLTCFLLFSSSYTSH